MASKCLQSALDKKVIFNLSRGHHVIHIGFHSLLKIRKAYSGGTHPPAVGGEAATEYCIL
jgi:hypothetical protein